MNILILGSGGREHAFAHKISRSDQLTNLYVAPGNAGTAGIAENLTVSLDDFVSIKEIVLSLNIDMVVVGPEAPLVAGIHDFFVNDNALQHIFVIGPKKDGAQLEGSKDFSKRFMEKNNIPTAKYQSFKEEDVKAGKRFLETLKPPYVLKADGLAAGKGVLILSDLEEARNELENMLAHKKFGAASSTVVIEEFLDGIELSVFVLTDGSDYKILPSAKDYKRIGENDTGLNTGGMGAISPVPFANDAFLKKVEDKIIKPTITGLQAENIDYQGFIFIGLMKVGDEPFVIEYNVRMGDPETEVVLPRIESDVLDLLEGVAKRNLADRQFTVSVKTAATVMLVSGGYPEAYGKGKPISGLDKIQDAKVFHAGTAEKDGKTVTNGGRVLAVTGMGNSIKGALAKSYKNIEKIQFEGMYYRKDIGFDLG